MVSKCGQNIVYLQPPASSLCANIALENSLKSFAQACLPLNLKFEFNILIQSYATNTFAWH